MRSARSAWGRFLLRLAAIAWPMLTYWYMATTRSSPSLHGHADDCAPVLLVLLLPALTVLGVVALVCAAGSSGMRQRYALWGTTAIGTTWAVIAVVVRWVVSHEACGLLS